MNEIDNILSLTPENLIKQTAQRVKQRRLESGFTQQELSRRSGVELATYRRFERTGEISLRSLALLTVTLNATDEFNLLFSKKNYATIEDVIKENKTPKRGKNR